MASVKFYLKDSQKDLKKGQIEKPSLIYMFFSYDNKRLKVSTRESILPRFWNEGEQLARRSFSGYSDFNESLKKFGEDYLKAYRVLKSVGESINSDSLRNKVDEINEVVNKENITLLAFISGFITSSEYKVTHGTIKSYKTTESVLKRFQKHRNRRLDFDSINLGFYDDFIGYQSRILKYSANTVGKNVKNLKVFMNEATTRGHNKNLEFLKKGFKVFKEDIDNIYLTEQELSVLNKLDLTHDPRKEHARDLFMVGCYTGLRFSDFSQLKPQNIKDCMFTIRTQKTNELVTIPIHPIIQQIMAKYKGKFDNSLPPAYANQIMNRYLKELGEDAGFEEMVSIKKTIAGKKKELSFSKFQLLTTHTARRSFATNLYLQEFPSISIMKITGHRSERAFMKYIKMTPHQNAEKLRKHWEKQSLGGIL